MDTLKKTVDKLCSASIEHYVNPFTYLQWPESRDPDAWYMPQELLSLHPTKQFIGLSEHDQRALSFFETVNFFSLNIHGEKHLIAELAKRLYNAEHHQTTDYLQHFLDEENKHMTYFGGFCNRFAGKIYPSRKVEFPREYQPGEEDFLFFAKVLIFEEIVDVYNRRAGKDKRIAEIARNINWIHHLEESRHLAFGRELVAKLFNDYADAWGVPKQMELQEYLTGYLRATWREYYNPDVYVDVNLDQPFELATTAWAAGDSHRQEVSAKLLRYFDRLGLSIAEGLQ
ncbi:MAG: diiron oxygenase [Gammaproteobacteria bacterium]